MRTLRMSYIRGICRVKCEEWCDTLLAIDICCHATKCCALLHGIAKNDNLLENSAVSL